jgi:hypothetical protein
MVFQNHVQLHAIVLKYAQTLAIVTNGGLLIAMKNGAIRPVQEHASAIQYVLIVIAIIPLIVNASAQKLHLIFLKLDLIIIQSIILALIQNTPLIQSL